MLTHLNKKLFALMAFTVILSGCSKFAKAKIEAEPTPTPPPVKYVESKGSKKEDSANTSGKIQLTFVAGKDKTGTLAKLISDYNSRNKDVVVTHKEISEDKREQYSYMSAALATGEASLDIFNIDSGWSAEFAQKGYIMHLDDYINAAALNLDDYLPNSRIPSRYNDRMYSMPRTVSMNMIFFRQDIVESAPTSWDEILRLAKKQGSYETTSGFIFGTRGGFDLSEVALELINSYGGYIFNSNGDFEISDKGVREALAELYKIYHAEGAAKDIYMVNKYTAATRFFSGEAVMMRNDVSGWFRGTGSESKISGKFAMSPMPRIDGNNPDILWCTALAINANSQYKDAAWDFIEFLVSGDSQKNFALYGGFVPALMSSMNDSDITQNNAYFKSKNFRSSLLEARPQVVNTGYSSMMQVFEAKVSDYLSGIVDLEATIDLMNTEMPAVLTVN